MNTKLSIPIAIADDHLMFRQSISRLISDIDGFHVVIEASNGKQLISMLEKVGELPEICILDIQMPEMNGYETIIELRKRWPNIKVLVLSMFNNEFAIIKTLRGGAKGYLLKDNDIEELERALTHIRNKGYYSSEFLSSSFFHTAEKENKQLQKLTDRELEFLRYCGTELTIKEIGAIMGINTRTTEGYRNSLYRKFNLHTRQGLAIFAISTGIISLEELAELDKTYK